MIVQVNTSNELDGKESLVAWVTAEVSDDLSRFADRLTRVEVHMNDLNGNKSGARDKRCMLEARPAGHPPLAVSAESESFDQSLHAALKKMRHSLESTLGRIDGQRGQRPEPAEFVEEEPVEQVNEEPVTADR